MSKINKRKALAMGGAAAVSLIMAVPSLAAAQTVTAQNSSHISTRTGTRERQGMGQKLATASFGIITSLNGSSFALMERSGSTTAEVTVTTSSATTYKTNGVAGTASLAVGHRVVVMGAKDSSGNITSATSVNVMIPREVHTSSNWRNK